MYITNQSADTSESATVAEHQPQVCGVIMSSCMCLLDRAGNYCE